MPGMQSKPGLFLVIPVGGTSAVNTVPTVIEQLQQPVASVSASSQLSASMQTVKLNAFFLIRIVLNVNSLPLIANDR
jgi:hypothetical protein